MENQDSTYFYPRQISARLIEEAEKRKIRMLCGVKRKFLTVTQLQEIYIILSSFMMGRAVLFGELAPFALAYWTIVYREKRKSGFGAALMLLAGSATVGFLPETIILFIGMLLVTLIERFTKVRGRKGFPLPLLSVFALIVSHGFFLLLNSFVLYDLFLFVMEIILIVPVTIFLSLGTALVWSEKREVPYKQEEIIGGLFLFVFLLLGLVEGPSWALFFQEVIPKTTVLVLAYFYGGALGAVAGLILGLFLCIGTQNFFYVSLLSFAGLLGGIFRGTGRAGAAAGYLTGIFLYALYVGGVERFFFFLPQGLAASLVFLLLPMGLLSWVNNFSPAFSLLTRSGEADEEIRSATSGKLKDLAQVFKSIALAFKEVARGEDEGEVENKVSRALIEETCRSCASYNTCRQEGFFYREDIFKEMLTKVGSGKITMRDLPFSLRKKCRYLGRFLKTVNSKREREMIEVLGRDCLREGKVVMAGQMEGIATIVNEFADEIKLKTDRIAIPGKYYNYTVEIGVAQLAKDGEEVSGDYYSLLSLKEGKQVIILSDGMGSGEKAKKESKATVCLLEEMLEVGLPRNLIFKTVNTVMQFRSGEETFATVDLAMLDLQEGRMELCKIGAAPSFIKRGQQVKELNGTSLPLGILAEVNMEIKKEKLENEDILIMVTDGISEAGVRVDGFSSWIKKNLLEKNTLHPQLIADSLLEEACVRNRGYSLDDMSVIVCKIIDLNMVS